MKEICSNTMMEEMDSPQETILDKTRKKIKSSLSQEEIRRELSLLFNQLTFEANLRKLFEKILIRLAICAVGIYALTISIWIFLIS